MADVRFEHVTKAFDGVVAVNDLTLHIHDGEFLVLVGPSGCGKSTALRCLAGLEEITSGSIYIGERDVTWLDPKDRDIAMVFQNYALYPHMTVRENMAFGLKLRRTPKAEIRRRVDAAAEALGIAHLLDRKPRALSGGQRQRVALGRAIVREPLCFLMDEPLSNLDAKLRVQTRAEISKLQRRLGATTVYVTHDQTEAMTMGDRIAVLNHGVLQQLDTPQALYDTPVNRFVATFIGSPAMNVFPVALRSDGEQLRVEADGFSVVLPPALASRARAGGDGTLLLGVRPEHLEVVEFAERVGQDNTVRLPVELVESLGSEVLLHLTGPDGVIVARVDPRSRYRAGDIAELAVAAESLHLFDPQTEMSLA
ncbi:MAG: glycerol-3-phosphate ABC transporter ATP-binding protein [Chloroflexi bacterium]|nr:MAG: glycerol-3-phosphate ABC transporter ATP-binding protein [Chloroflexota bacterium]